MKALREAIQHQISEWLDKGDIEVFIGWEAGTDALQATPAFVRDAKDVGDLIWDPTCENNLVAFLPRYRGKKVGIMVKGCDSRAIIGLMQEGQLQREDLRIVGASCPGVVDANKVAGLLGVGVEDLEVVRVEADQVIVGEKAVPVAQVRYDLCLSCDRHNPIIYDVRVGEEIDDSEVDWVTTVRAMEALSDAERWERFTAEVERCNLCYACRNACPLCYCNVCFADRSQPRWFNQTTRPEDRQFYQVMRTFHLAGRCVSCGACTRACPQGVDIRLLLDKLRSDVLELYGHTAGVDPEAEPPLRAYSADDYNDFVM